MPFQLIFLYRDFMNCFPGVNFIAQVEFFIRHFSNENKGFLLL